jgi:hypothetical protein
VIRARKFYYFFFFAALLNTLWACAALSVCTSAGNCGSYAMLKFEQGTSAHLWWFDQKIIMQWFKRERVAVACMQLTSDTQAVICTRWSSAADRWDIFAYKCSLQLQKSMCSLFVGYTRVFKCGMSRHKQHWSCRCLCQCISTHPDACNHISYGLLKTGVVRLADCIP